LHNEDIVVENEGDDLAGNFSNCPIYNKRLHVNEEVFNALVDPTEISTLPFIHNIARSIRRHCVRFHINVPLWLATEHVYLFDKSVSVGFYTKK
jgi:hypothetical protein